MLKPSILTLLAFGALFAARAVAEPTSEFIFTEAPFASCHASTVMETENGELLAAWFGGSREGDNDVAIWMSRRGDGGWSAPREFAREPNTPTWNPVLFRSADGVTGAFYKFGTSPREWTGAYRTSTDDGRTWSGPTRLPAGLYGPIRAKPYLLPTERSSRARPSKATNRGRAGSSAAATTGAPGRVMARSRIPPKPKASSSPRSFRFPAA